MANAASLGTSIRFVVHGFACDEAVGFGPGAAAILSKVAELGSLNAAAKSMGMAYTKAWKLMKSCEAGLGFSLLVRDGARGSTLTSDAEALLSAYDATLADLNELAAKRFAEHYSGA